MALGIIILHMLHWKIKQNLNAHKNLKVCFQFIRCFLISKCYFGPHSYRVIFYERIRFFFLLFRAASAADGSSQARSQIRATAASLCHSHSNSRIWALSATYTIGHGNARSPTHWARLGIEPASSWILVGFVSAAPWRELPRIRFFKSIIRINSIMEGLSVFITWFLLKCWFLYLSSGVYCH